MNTWLHIKAWLAKLSVVLGAYGPWGLFLLCAADSFGVPLPAVPDLLMVGIATGSAKSPHHAWFAALMAVLGSIAGNVGLYVAARHGAAWLRKTEPPPGKRTKFHAWFHQYGLLTVFVPAAVPFVPLPLKVFVVSAGALRTPFDRFLAVIVLARVIRYFGEAWLGLALGAGALGFLTRNGWALAGAASALALAMFLVMRLLDRRRQAA
jgi:membrane protein YqaA with SNARE-associated domain